MARNVARIRTEKENPGTIYQNMSTSILERWELLRHVVIENMSPAAGQAIMNGHFVLIPAHETPCAELDYGTSVVVVGNHQHYCQLRFGPHTIMLGSVTVVLIFDEYSLPHPHCLCSSLQG